MVQGRLTPMATSSGMSGIFRSTIPLRPGLRLSCPSRRAGSPHTITLVAYDDFDPIDSPSDTVDVTVRINHRPVVDAHLPELVFDCIGAGGQNVSLNASGFSDPDGHALTFSWIVQQTEGGGAYITHDGLTLDVLLQPGTYQVTVTADDGNGGVQSDGGLVRIIADTTPPTLVVSVSPSVINANNHKMVAITATVTSLDDACDPNPTVTLLSITSNESDNGAGDTANDIQGADVGTDDRSFSLRAERSGSNGGRVYTVTYEATDAAGNSSEASATVTVPHDESGS